MGGFLTFLVSLWLLVPKPEVTETSVNRPTAQPEARADEMQWEFWEIFPRSEVPVVEEYNQDGEKVQTDQYLWILQAGSFREANDADELRARLLLLGLDASTTAVELNKETWHRVIVGPFESELDRNRAQDRLAQAEVRAMPVRIPR